MPKRQLGLDSNRCLKRPHISDSTILLLYLDNDCVSIIFSLLDSDDVKSLSLTNSAYRDLCVSYMFRNIRASWGSVMTSEQVPYPQYVSEINIINHWEYGEWNSDLFDRLKMFTNIRLVKINSIGSCGWLRYRKSSINLLHLYPDTSDSGCGRRLDYVEPINPMVRGFRLDTLNGFPNLNVLHLNKYRFLWTDLLLCVPLRELHLLDCKWNHPFVLDKFNQLNLLEVLSLEYSALNNFLLSDCFKRFVTNVDSKGLQSLRSLHIDIDAVDTPHVSGKSPLLSKTILSGFLRKEKYPYLDRLCLNGWALNPRAFPLIVEDELRTHVTDLEVMIVAVGNDRAPISEISAIRMEALKLMPGVNIRLKVRKRDKIHAVLAP